MDSTGLETKERFSPAGGQNPGEGWPQVNRHPR